MIKELVKVIEIIVLLLSKSVTIVNMRLLTLILLFFYGLNCRGNSDSLRYDSLLNHSIALCYSNPDSAYKLITQILTENRQHKNRYFTAKSLNVMGIYYDITNHWDSALHLYQQAYNEAKQIQHKKLQASILNNIGLIYWNESKHDTAIIYYTRALELFEQTKHLKGQAGALNNIGLIMNDLDAPEKASIYLTKSLHIRQKINDRHGVATSYTNLGLTYDAFNNIDSALYYYQKSIIEKRALNDNYGLGISYNNLAALYLNKLNYLDSAEHYTIRAIEFFEQLKNTKHTATNYATLGYVYLQKKQFDKAEKNLKKAEYLSDSNNLSFESLKTYERLAMLYEQQKQYQLAQAYYKKTYHTYSKLYKDKLSNDIIELQEKYESEKKQKQIAHQQVLIAQQNLENQKKNYTILITFSIIVLLIIILFLIVKTARHKQQLASEKLKQELYEQRSRIARDLHDNIGSQLTFVTAGLDLLSYKPEKVIEQSNKLSTFMREVIHQLRQTVWVFNKDRVTLPEIEEKIKHSLRLWETSSSKTEIHLFNHIPSGTSFLPLIGINILRILQEAINNALKHANASKITIEITQDESFYHFKVSDNGKGMDNNSSAYGNGIGNIEKRAQEINGTVFFHSEKEQGTVVHLKLKNQLV